MVSRTGSTTTNMTMIRKFSNATTKNEIEAVANGVTNHVITVIINSGITCPFTVPLNVLVIMAVKRRPRLQNNANILLACLAATDALTGLTSQPSFVLWTTFRLFGVSKLVRPALVFYSVFIRVLSVCSCLHLKLVTCESLIAIKFTMHYHNVLTEQKFKAAITSCWIFSVLVEFFKWTKVTAIFSNFLVALVVVSSSRTSGEIL